MIEKNKIAYIEVPIPDSTYSDARKATEEEIRHAEAEYITDECTHKLFYDEPGFMYNIRTCYICGEGLGLI